MSTVSQMIRNHHREILRTLTDQVGAIAEGRTDASPDALVTFLTGDLLPHARGEERHLYSAIEPQIKAHGSATATMSVDHEFIQDYISQLESAVKELRTAPAAERTALNNRIQRLALELGAVIRVHLEKEERVYLPLFEEYLSEEQQQQVLDGMHSAYH
ncbi:MAG: hemerythrin domain-containing protein [Chloroflexi bacterium]|nr:hemerythrin domain-containing protein [Chloroflexota bacterium]